jgi:N-acyl-D-aspartate/D-glutamate deacylase
MNILEISQQFISIEKKQEIGKKICIPKDGGKIVYVIRQRDVFLCVCKSLERIQKVSRANKSRFRMFY